MWPLRKSKAQQLQQQLATYSKSNRRLRGLPSTAAREALAWQMVSSLRRLDYTEMRRQRDISPHRADPNHSMFDPEVAAIYWARSGNLDEAFWLAFLATHFGKHKRHGWTLLKDVYSGLGASTWTWSRVIADPKAFEDWIVKNRANFRGAFGNHRKYETLKPTPKGTGAVMRSYVDWVGASHQALVATLVRQGGNDPHSIFEAFYSSMNVQRFGRLGKFDFLALVGRLGLAPIEPGSAHIREATGPRAGSRLLFLGDENDSTSDNELDSWVIDLGAHLGVGMQVMEDSICNWQKSPTRFVHFRG